MALKLSLIPHFSCHPQVCFPIKNGGIIERYDYQVCYTPNVREIHTKEQLEEVEDFFSSIKPTIESFCRDHNFSLQKYGKQAASWKLQGRLSVDRSKSVMVTIAPEGEETVSLSFHICLDNFKTLERKVYWSPSAPCEKSPAELLTRLRDLLTSIKSFDGKWSDSTTLSEWGGYSSSELEKFFPEYPKVKL